MYWLVGPFENSSSRRDQVIGVGLDCGIANRGYKERDDRTRCHEQMDEPEVYKILHPVELQSKNRAGVPPSKATSRSGGET